MEAKRKVLALAFIFLALIGIFYSFTYLVTKTTGYNISEKEEVLVAQCLSGKGAVIYIKENCKECKEIKEMFGIGWKFLDVKKCDDEKCRIDRFPSLKFEGKEIAGLKSLDEIKEISGC